MTEMMMRRRRTWRSSKYQLHEMEMTQSVSNAVSTVQSPMVLLVLEKLLWIAVTLSCACLLE